jgi:uncharacterized repeat protein (TIGR04052 family)
MKKILIIAVGVLLLFGDRADGQTPSTSQAEQQVVIDFAGRLAGKPFACGSQYEGVGISKTLVNPQDLRFFVSNVQVLRADGTAVPVALDQDGIWQYKSVALIDLEDGTGACRNGNSGTHRTVKGNVPSGTYVGLRFTVGVPAELDHIDPTQAASPLNMTAMFWNWQFGYKFIRAEVAAVVAADGKTNSAKDSTNNDHSTKAKSGEMRSAGFPVHIGSTGCAGPGFTSPPIGACKNPNLVHVELPKFDAGKDIVIFDLDKLLAESDITTNTPDTPPGCMSGESDPDCAPVMKFLGLAFRGVTPPRQVVFYAEPKP